MKPHDFKEVSRRNNNKKEERDYSLAKTKGLVSTTEKIDSVSLGFSMGCDCAQVSGANSKETSESGN